MSRPIPALRIPFLEVVSTTWASPSGVSSRVVSGWTASFSSRVFSRDGPSAAPDSVRGSPFAWEPFCFDLDVPAFTVGRAAKALSSPVPPEPSDASLPEGSGGGASAMAAGSGSG
ncbi:hypothetical protein STIAU_1150, partial [Stigmatella aurantiaca DW4/3-1]